MEFKAEKKGSIFENKYYIVIKSFVIKKITTNLWKKFFKEIKVYY